MMELEAALFEEFFIVFIDVRSDFGAARRALRLFPECIRKMPSQDQNAGVGSVLIGEGVDGDFVGDHVGGVKAESKVADDLVFFVLDLYLPKKSSAPEKAIWAMYFSTSSAVIPMPVSVRSGLCFFVDGEIDPKLFVERYLL